MHALTQNELNYQNGRQSAISLKVRESVVNTKETTTLVTRVGKKSFYTHFAPPHPCAMLRKHFHLTQVCILPFSNERGNGGVDTYSVGITIIISCFWHFPTKFFQGCRFN